MQWRKVNDQFMEVRRTSLNDRVIKLYMGKIRIGFSLWRDKHLKDKKDERKANI